MWSNPGSTLLMTALSLSALNPMSDSRTPEPASDIRIQDLPYVSRLDRREPGEIEGVVIHATELPDLATAREYGEREVHESDTGNSGHFYIDRDGTVHRWVPLHRIAHHVAGWNAGTVGIELVNRGRYPAWFDSRSQDWSATYPQVQIEALIGLLQSLQGQLPDLSWIAGHAQLDQRSVNATDDPDIQVRRKLDPGATFPWPTVLDAISLQRLQNPVPPN